MLELSHAIQAFGQLAGLDEQEGEQWRALCQSGLDTLKEMLRPGADTPENCHRLTMAAAAIAYYRYCLIVSGQEVHTLKAGDLQVSTDPGRSLEQAAALREEFLRGAQDCLCRAPVVFRQVNSL